MSRGISNHFKGKWVKTDEFASALALTFSAVLFLSEIQLIQYTMTSALLAATAIFLLVTEQERSPETVYRSERAVSAGNVELFSFRQMEHGDT